MVFEMISWVYISLICLIWGNLILKLLLESIRKHYKFSNNLLFRNDIYWDHLFLYFIVYSIVFLQSNLQYRFRR